MGRYIRLHNWPGLPAGDIAGVMDGAMMASLDTFLDITVTGKGSHCRYAHIMGFDPSVSGFRSRFYVYKLLFLSCLTMNPRVKHHHASTVGEAINVCLNPLS